MAKIRVQDVANELNIPVQTVIKKLEELSIYVGAGAGATTLKPEEYYQVKVLITTGKKVKVVKKKKTADSAKAAGAEEAKSQETAKAAAPSESEKPAETKKEAAAEAPAKTEDVKPVKEVKSEEKQPAKEEAPVADAKQEEKAAPKAEKAEKAEAVKAEPEKTPEVKTEAKPEVKPEVKAEVKPEVKPEAKAEAAEPKKEEKPTEAEKEAVIESKLDAAMQAAIAVGLTPAGAGKTVAKNVPTKREVKAPVKREQPKTQGQNGKPGARGEAGKGPRQDRNGRPQNSDRPQGRRDAQGQDGRSGEFRSDRSRTNDRGMQDHRQGQFGKDRKEGERSQEGRSRLSGNRQGNAAMQGAAGKDEPVQTRRPAPRRNDAKRPAGGDYYDMGLSAPSKNADSQKDRKSQEQDKRRQNNKQKATGSEDYKNKKSKLMQEASYLDDDRLARHKKKPVKHAGSSQHEEEEEIKIVQLPESMTVKELADALHKPINVVIKSLMLKGIMAGLNQIIDYDTAEGIATEMDILVEHQVEEDIFAKYAEVEDAEEDLQPRSPVVVVMGHVDHGKTSLLDAIRNTNVTAREAGGITQHIGASVVTINGQKITFLDTPGHEAFTAMRMRGAQVTDIAILVVAADDGVMPQTIEAINHAKAAGVQIIVAINKMDKYGANPDRVKQELTEYGLIAEDWGGSTICVPVSALKHEGIDTLLEMVLLVADMQELKANPNRLAVGTVIESQLDKGRGAVATVLVQKGTLHVGDPVVAGSAYGRVKAMTDDKGRRIKEAGPSVPVEITGLNEVPTAGDTFYMTESDREARLLAEKVAARERVKLIEGNKKVNLNDLFGDIQSGEVKDLNILVKADVQGSVEAVKQSLEKLSNDQVNVKVIHGAVGGVNESDIMLASAANAIIIGFNVRPDAMAKAAAEEQKVDIRLYRVIYNAIDDITAAMKGMLAPEFEEVVSGHATVRQIFHASGVGTIAGSYVTDGKIVRGSQVRLVRDGIVVFEGQMASLRRFKDDVKEVATGYECGIMLEKFNDVKEGDVIEAFSMEEIKRE